MNQGIHLCLAQMGKSGHMMPALLVPLHVVRGWVEDALSNVLRGRPGLPGVAWGPNALLSRPAQAILRRAKQAAGIRRVKLVAHTTVLLFVDLYPVLNQCLAGDAINR